MRSAHRHQRNGDSTTEYNNMTITSLPDTASMTIEDVQGRADTRRIPINRPGSRTSVIRFVSASVRRAAHTIATASMYVNLPRTERHAHVPLRAALNEHDRPIDAMNFGMVTEADDRLDAEDGHIEMASRTSSPNLLR